MAGGRPTKLTPKLKAVFVRVLGKGMPRETACKAACIHPATFYDWMAQARQPGAHKSLVEFSEAVQRAEADHAERMLQRIEEAADAGPSGWTAAAWALERRHGMIKREHVEMQADVKTEGPDFSKLTPDELRAYRALLLKLRKGDDDAE